MSECELTHLPRQQINHENAGIQHENYRKLLSDCGLRQLITLEENIHLPDCAFVEDNAIVLDEIAIITPMGVASRVAETYLIETNLAAFRQIARIDPPARIEGGDVLQMGRTLFVGISTRTDSNGLTALNKIADHFGYKLVAVNVRNALHLKTACTAIDDETILLNPEWVDAVSFTGFRQIPVPSIEPCGANILRIGNKICIHSGFQETSELLVGLGYDVNTVDISEFLKAEAGLTCLSIIFSET